MFWLQLKWKISRLFNGTPIQTVSTLCAWQIQVDHNNLAGQQKWIVFFSFVLVDAPSRKKADYREWHHWYMQLICFKSVCINMLYSFRLVSASSHYTWSYRYCTAVISLFNSCYNNRSEIFPEMLSTRVKSWVNMLDQVRLQTPASIATFSWFSSNPESYLSTSQDWLIVRAKTEDALRFRSLPRSTTLEHQLLATFIKLNMMITFQFCISNWELKIMKKNSSWHFQFMLQNISIANKIMARM